MKDSRATLEELNLLFLHKIFLWLLLTDTNLFLFFQEILTQLLSSIYKRSIIVTLNMKMDLFSITSEKGQSTCNDKEKKGFFPHLFNKVEFYNYKGSFPSFEWYDPDNFRVEKRREFFEWYKEQVAKEVVFDFQQEMISYCHSNLQLLRLGVEKFKTFKKKW